MYYHVHHLDLPNLMGAGFKFGIADTILWGKDKYGQEYQAVIDGEWIRFGARRPSGGVDSLERMRRDKFQELFL